MPVGRAAPSSKVQDAYRVIKRRIVDGRYGPGVRLVLQEIADDLGVSALPVREAVRRLEAEGWVTFGRNVGAKVRLLDADQHHRSLETLALLEGYATAAAAPLLGEGTLARAYAINEALQQALTAFDPAGFARLHREFHALLCAGSPNEHLLSLLELERQRAAVVDRAAPGLGAARAHESIDEHLTLLGMIGSGAAPDAIESYARWHGLSVVRAAS